jgi:hypothetical protein
MNKYIFAVFFIALSLAAYFFWWKNSSFDKDMVFNNSSKRQALVNWVDTKSVSGFSEKTPKNPLVFNFYGDYETDIDFEKSNFALSDEAVARIALDENGSPESILLIDESYCGYIIHSKHTSEKNKNNKLAWPSSGIRMTADRMIYFCLKRH